MAWLGPSLPDLERSLTYRVVDWKFDSLRSNSFWRPFFHVQVDQKLSPVMEFCGGPTPLKENK